MDFIKVQSLKWLMSNFLLFTERNLSTTSSSDILSIHTGDEHFNAKLFNLLYVMVEKRLELSLFRSEKLRSASILVIGIHQNYPDKCLQR